MSKGSGSKVKVNDFQSLGVEGVLRKHVMRLLFAGLFSSAFFSSAASPKRLIPT